MRDCLIKNIIQMRNKNNRGYIMNKQKKIWIQGICCSFISAIFLGVVPSDRNDGFVLLEWRLSKSGLVAQHRWNTQHETNGQLNRKCVPFLTETVLRWAGICNTSILLHSRASMQVFYSTRRLTWIIRGEIHHMSGIWKSPFRFAGILVLRSGMSVPSVRNGGSVLPEYWLSKSGLVAHAPPEYL